MYYNVFYKVCLIWLIQTHSVFFSFLNHSPLYSTFFSLFHVDQILYNCSMNFVSLKSPIDVLVTKIEPTAAID